ncbi:MAG: capsular biosynthesis protein [Clostridia bacterium]|nr:capsular biosynthesis protein [Clostridia bacterium]
MIDVHCHILPGIDDGSRSIEESMEMIKEAYEAGFTNIISTSHYIEESYNVPKARRQELIDMLNSKIEQEGMKIKIYNGAEAYITPNLAELIKAEELPTMNGTKYLLMELPMHNQILNLESIVSKVINQGITLIIAHPERYDIVQKNYKVLNELADMGVLFQANYGSCIGQYGKEAEKTLKKLLKANRISFFGTDCHRAGSVYEKMPEILKKLEKMIGKEKLEELTTINPQKLL